MLHFKIQATPFLEVSEFLSRNAEVTFNLLKQFNFTPENLSPG